jgi:plasmid stabilization system protein ParE
MTKLRLSVAAQRDLEAIQEIGLRDFGANAAREHLAGFERIFSMLREHPSAGRSVRNMARAFGHSRTVRTVSSIASARMGS